MQTKIINPGYWELDISHIKLSTSQQNSYFTDDFFGTITYPFEINISELTPQFIFHYNTNKFQKVYDKCILERNGKIEECQLIVLEFDGKNMSLQLVLGFEDFPNFDKKLSELPLFKLKLSGQTLYQHANSLVNKTYPETNYTFPAVHTDLISTDNYLFSAFKGTYNLYQNGSFVKNNNDEQIYNYNILEPAVSYLYILITGFSAAGYTLQGDILNDSLLKKTFIFKGNTYSNETYPEPITWLANKLGSEVSGAMYKNRQEIGFNGTFRIKGIAYILGWGNIFRIKDISTGNVVWESQSKKNTETIDIIVYTSKDTVLEFEGYDPGAGFTGNKILELTITPVKIYKEDGSIYNPNFNNPEIDLTKNVPDITFGDAVKGLKNTFNIDVDHEAKVINMNYIEENIRDLSNLEDIRPYEVKNAVVAFNESLSFLLKFEYEDEQYPFESVYVDKNGSTTKGFSKQKNTKEIVSPMIPLPLILRNNLNSAKSLTDGETNIQLLLYSGLKSGKNETEINTPLLMPQLYDNYWKKWLKFRIFSDTFKWKFNVKKKLMQNLSTKTKIYAYNRIHIIKKLDREDLSQDSEEIELETNSE